MSKISLAKARGLPAMPWRQALFDDYSSPSPGFVREQPRTREEQGDGRISKPKSHGLGLQIPYRFHSDVPA